MSNENGWESEILEIQGQIIFSFIFFLQPMVINGSFENHLRDFGSTVLLISC